MADRLDASRLSRFFHSISTVAPEIVGTARKKLNSAAVLRSTPSISAAMMVAPERDTPGIMATHWPSPISSELRVVSASTPNTLASPIRFSIHRIAKPPMISETATVVGLSSMASTALMNSTPMIAAGRKPRNTLRMKAKAVGSRTSRPRATPMNRPQ